MPLRRPPAESSIAEQGKIALPWLRWSNNIASDVSSSVVGIPVSGSPADGQALLYDASGQVLKWVTPSGGGGGVQLAGDLGNTDADPHVIGLQGNQFSNNPGDGQVPTYSLATGEVAWKTPAALTGGNIFTGLVLPNTNSGWSNYSIIVAITSVSLLTLANTWKVGMVIQSGQAHIAKMVVLRTLFNSATVVDSTTVTLGGAGAFYLNPGETFTDPIPRALDTAHDTYVVAYFDTDPVNGSVAVGQNSLTLSNGVQWFDPTGDQTGASSISSFGSAHSAVFFDRGVWVS